MDFIINEEFLILNHNEKTFINERLLNYFGKNFLDKKS